MSSARFDVKDQVAVVTGGGRGIGFAIARALAEAGARIVLAEIDPDILKTGQDKLVAAGHDTIGLAVDVTDAASVDTLVDTVMARFGRVDILVNSAGIFRVTPAIDVTDEEWRAVMEVNSGAVFRCARAFGRHMIARGSGSIVNVGSISGVIINRPQTAAHYMASKAAVHHLTKSLAVEWAQSGVRVNAVAPGYITTEMTIALKNIPEIYNANVDMIPMKRFGEPEEVAAAALFLASPAASYITGTIIMVDGGYTAW